MSIFKELRDAADIAHRAGDRDRERDLDRANVLVGAVTRELNEQMTQEAFRLAVTVWTQAILLLGTEPRRVA
jgi:hypothetical protein